MACRLGNRGNAYIEYFILAIMVGLATLAFFFDGGFDSARESINLGFDNAMMQIVDP